MIRPSGNASTPRASLLGGWGRAGLLVPVLTGLYFAVPLRPHQLGGSQLVVRGILVLAGVAVLCYLVVRQIRRTIATGRLAAEQVAALLILANIIIVFFGAAYYLMSGQFTGLHTRLDGLYFAVTTLATVGFGDITPTTQTARALVTIQMLFDLILITSAISIIVSAAVQSRVAQRFHQD